MAVGIVPSSGGIEAGKDYPGETTMYVIIACIVAAMGGLIFGYDIGISGGVTSMTPFLKSFFPSVYRKESGIQSSNQYCKFDSQILTLFTSSLYIAALLASFVASWITRRFGRTWTIFYGGLVFVVGAIMNGLAQNIAMLIIGRLLLGVGVGFASQSVPLYLSEMAPYKMRGALNQMFQLFITVGILIANVLNYFTNRMENGWRWSLGLAAVPGLVILVGGIFLPETPNFLIDRNRSEEAKKRLQRIRGVANVDEEYNDLVAASEASKKVTDPWHRLFFDRKYRPQLTYSVALPSLQQITGINVVMFYAPVLFKTLGFGGDASLMSALITGGVNVLATFVAIWLADRKGRRTLFLAGGIQMFISQLVVGGLIWYKFKWSGEGNVSGAYAIIVVLFICAFVTGFAYSWGPLAWLVISEILPLEVRSAGQSVNVSLNMFWTFVIGQAFLILLCHLKFLLFFVFAICVLGMSLFIYITLPETKGIPIEEMSRIWSLHSFWKKYIPTEDGVKLEEI
ncbi:hypothetical protein AQUCO_01300872v1 [Aquilegia coerulea]|uniref:Major facilitator superfamily (MFS) profile domain-containing protein n=1 Tax=Aquilegia coerulea TaxID=218851 RepID=A0A2G5E3U1_AQUCA|nr:hypothetical protein AQUCO_01300872v1 [Aquilegia coerulea]